MLPLLRYVRGRRRTFLSLLASHLTLGILPVALFAALTFRFFNRYVGDRVTAAELARLRQSQSAVCAVLELAEQKSYEFVLNARYLDLGSVDQGTITTVDAIMTVRQTQELLRNLKSTDEVIHSAYFYNPASDFLVTSSNYSVVSGRFHDTEWIGRGLQVRGSTPKWLPTRLDMDSRIRGNADLMRMYAGLSIKETPVITLVRPVSRALASYGGFVIVNVKVPLLAQRMGGTANGPDTELLILEASGMVLLSTGRTALETSFEPRLVEASRRAPEGSLMVSQAGGPRVCYYVVGANGWIYVLSRDAAAIAAFARGLGRTTFLLALALVILGTLVALNLSSRLYHPIDAILRVVETQAGREVDRVNELTLIHDTLGGALRESAELRAFVDRSAEAIKETILRRLLSGTPADEEDVLARLRHVGAHFEHPLFAVALIIIEQAARLSSTRLHVAQAALIRFSESPRTEGMEVLGVATDVGRIALLINATDRDTAARELDTIRRSSSEALGLRTSMAVGRFYGSVLKTAASYDDALAVDPRDGVVFRDAVDPGRDGGATYPFDCEERLIYNLKLDRRDEVRHFFDVFLGRIAQDGGGGSRRIESACLTLVGGIVRAVEHSGSAFPAVAGSDNPYRALLAQGSDLEALRAWFYALFDRVMDKPHPGADKGERYRQAILQCIEQHCSQDISLEQVARLTGISYSYIRKIFSHLTGSHFPDYLNALRIQKAKEYLRNTSRRISEIASTVGYTNEQRFFRNFKKLTGCTPKDYRLGAASAARIASAGTAPP